jgi:bacterioferritin-associated ferredoxin
MDKNEYVCVCHRVSLGKLQSYIHRENPKVASQLSKCLDAGTSCGWCIPYLCQLFHKHKSGEAVALEIDATRYLEERKVFNEKKRAKEKKDE